MGVTRDESARTRRPAPLSVPVVPPGQHREGIRGVVPPGQHRDGIRGVVPPGQHRGPAPASVLVLAGIVSVQLGAGLAGRLFADLGPAGVTGLRLWWSALIVAAAGCRPAIRAVRGAVASRAWRDLTVVVAFGVVLGVMNFSIYQSFARIPLGVAVTIEFLGPLAVAVASSRRALDAAWVVLAGAGVLLLTEGGAGHAGHANRAGPVLGLSTEAAGVAFALVAAACWAGYILLSRATGRRFGGSSGLVIAMVVAATLVTGPAVAAAGPALARPGVIAAGLAIGLLSSVIPYRLELEALRRVPARVFGIWMSLEPAVAAFIGLTLLGESLLVRQWLAIALVIVACAGAARHSTG
ncbi:MAG: EamA family transporter [Streptosporangiaceae bacterium]